MKKNYSNIKDNSQKVLSFLALSFLIIFLPDFALAFGKFDTTLCDTLKAILGKPAKVIATFGIVFLGIGAFFGKLNWGTAMLFGTGIIMIFAAGNIVQQLSGAPVVPGAPVC